MTRTQPRHTVFALEETTRHRLLADEQRRSVIESLLTAGRGDTTLDAFAARLQRAGHGQVDSRQHLRCRLHHVHLPMLADAGLLEYDGETKRISLDGPRALPTPAEQR
ncbi:DUF7344 domain-containing protein [Haloarcula sediminis]|uniref:DUF7344 domain-containing protein n=1 Tax=Haloarcula sediminis TaxID=3111777 RepID=UPI002D794DC9|nr:hypothetical protein [Haloarcula sp. CK38]